MDTLIQHENSLYMNVFKRMVLAAWMVCEMVSCTSTTHDEAFTLRIRIREDVDCLHPIVSQSTLATQIEALVMLPMIEYSPDMLELSPLLVTATPEIVSSTDSSVMYETNIRPEARWDDGSAIQAGDYAFTVKAALNPYIKNPSWKSFLKNIHSIQTDSAKPALLRIEVARDYMLGKEVSGNVNLYPEYIYDPEKIMRRFSVQDLVQRDSAQWSAEEHALLKRFAEQFESASFCKLGIQGAGPYQLKSWDSGSKIVLERKKNWWGKAFETVSPLMQAVPQTIEYLVMPDEAAAVLAVKEGSVDLMTDVSPKQFSDLRNDSTANPQLQFLTASHFQYALLELNTRHPVLAELPVRQALASLADVNTYIKDLMMGLADPIAGPVHPVKPYYNKDLVPVPFDPEKARTLLAENGWKDTDADGWLDKMVNGKKQKLSLRFLVSGVVSKNIALLMQESAKKLGIELIPEMKEAALMRKDINERNFDIVSVTITQQATTLYDPFQAYHSSTAKPGGGNRSGLQSPVLDSLIMGIRTSQDQAARWNYYHEFQKALYALQPQIFLFSPYERLLAHRRIEFQTINRRPGYLENTFMLRK